MSEDKKKQFCNAIDQVNNGNVDGFDAITHTDLSLLTIDTTSGENVEIQDKKTILKMFMAIGSHPGNLKVIEEKLLVDNDELCILGYLKGTKLQTQLGLFSFDIPFKYRDTIYAKFDGEKIKRIEIYHDTFEVMRLCGRAILRQNNQEKIRNYLLNLEKLGFISKKSVIN